MTENGPDSARYQALIQLLRTAEDLWNASRVFFARWDLSPSQFNVLNLLYGQIDGLSQSELSRLLIMHRSNATGLIDRLERRRLVQRTEDPQDRRAYRVLLTPNGIDLLQTIYPHYFKAADAVWAGLPDQRVEGLLRELRDLATQATQVAARPPTGVPDAPQAPRRTRSTPAPRERNGRRSVKPATAPVGGIDGDARYKPQLGSEQIDDSIAGLRTADL
ncbi:MAG: MarR family transcriptional regulator [Verrucomicrobiales bacterium]|nr:MarR family transcriptional regulator [Verrucomicrobiales bacterium]